MVGFLIAAALTLYNPYSADSLLQNTNVEVQMDTITTKSGLKYVDLLVGEGVSPETGNKVTVHYTGWLTNGKKFDSSVDRGKPFTFTIGYGQVIKGWDEGVATMKVGGKRKLIIPSNLGYGSRGAGGIIPPYAELVFEVQLISIEE
jgi:peptidylprolyl isomerase